jgi:hypothetical protein
MRVPGPWQNGNTALLFATRYLQDTWDSEKVKVMRLLIENNAEVNAADKVPRAHHKSTPRLR